MQKIIILLLSMIMFFGCKERPRSELSDGNILKTKKNDSISNFIDYHKLIDLALKTYNEVNANKIVYLKYTPVENPLPEKYTNYIVKHEKLSAEEKKLALELIKSGKDNFEFNQKKLNEESRNILENLNKQTNQNVTYIFNSFLSNNKNDLVISTAGVLINNESFNTGTSGAEIIIFFKKNNKKWKIANTISTIEY